MATNYPDSPDIFLEPTLPEETPLSSSGPGGTRNHTEHHRDLGDAIEAIQVTAALKTHDHSGTDSIRHGPKLSQANTHQDPDTDTSAAALHHTLGVGSNQAAAGDHGYLASTSFQPGHHYIICTSSTHEVSYEGLLAYETDTRRLMIFANGKWYVIWSLPAVAPPPPPPVYVPPDDPAPPPVVVIPDPPPPPVPIPVTEDPAPICTVYSGTAQTIDATNWGRWGEWKTATLEWHQESTDPMNMFNPRASLTDVIIPKDGVYTISAKVFWDPNSHADEATLYLVRNGQGFSREGPTTIMPRHPTSMTISATVWCEVNDHISVQAQYLPTTGLGALLTIFDPTASVNGVFTVQYIGSHG